MPVFFPPGTKAEINVTEDFLAFSASLHGARLIELMLYVVWSMGEGVSQNQPAQLNTELGQTLAATTHCRAQQASWF